MLADGMLSLQDLMDARLASGAIAVLSACETGVIGETLPDEVLSIASGMLQAGASAVVSSLWSVPDASTAILMSRFYFLWRTAGQAPAVALRDAQRWMRDSNNGTIAAFLREHLGDLADRPLVRHLERNPVDSTFTHQMHWAAFHVHGPLSARAVCWARVPYSNLDLRPVTPEVAGSSPVGPAKLKPSCAATSRRFVFQRIA